MRVFCLIFCLNEGLIEKPTTQINRKITSKNKTSFGKLNALKKETKPRISKRL